MTSVLQDEFPRVFGLLYVGWLFGAAVAALTGLAATAGQLTLNLARGRAAWRVSWRVSAGAALVAFLGMCLLECVNTQLGTVWSVLLGLAALGVVAVCVLLLPALLIRRMGRGEQRGSMTATRTVPLRSRSAWSAPSHLTHRRTLAAR